MYIFEEAENMKKVYYILHTLLNDFMKDPVKIELLYIFLVSYYQYYREYIEYVLPRGGRWILLKDLAYMQFKVRGANPEEVFSRLQNVMDTYGVSGREAYTIIRIIESKYSKMLEELIDKRLQRIGDEQGDLIRKFVAFVFFKENGRRNISWESFTKLEGVLGKDQFNELYKLLVSTGLVIVHGYRSITKRGPVDHIGLTIPPWSYRYLKEVFKNYIGELEYASRKIISELEEEIHKKCPICEKPIREGEKYVTIYKFNVHYDKCYRAWQERIRKIQCSLTSDYETVLAREFLALALGIIKGDYYCEVPVSKKLIYYPFISSRRIDLVIRTEDADWIIEVERELNYEAIGQVLAYAILWLMDHPDRKIVKAIVTESADDELLEVANILGIKVFSKI